MEKAVTQKKPNYELIDSSNIPEGTILPDDQWALRIDGTTVVINSIKFGEGETENTVNITYEIIENPPEDTEVFDRLVADVVDSIFYEVYTLELAQQTIKEKRKLDA